MRKFILPLLLPVVAGAVFLRAQNLPVYGATAEYRFNGHYYRLYTGQADLETAAKTAIRDGGYLVEIDSDDENRFLVECFGAYVGKFLIGAVRSRQGEWTALSGKPLSCSNWNNAGNTAPEGNSPMNAVIEFQQAAGKWEPFEPSAKAAGFIAEFNSAPRPRPNISDAAGLEDIPEAEKEDSEKAEKNELSSGLPSGGISADQLFSRHVYAGGVFRERYADKEITVAGITRVADIREITDQDAIWSKYRGKFFMRILGDNIICFLNAKPLIEGDSPRIMVKVQGKIIKGPQFQQIILEDARFLNYRNLQPQRQLSTGDPEEEMVQAGGMLTKFDDLLNKGTFELQTNQEGAVVSCTLGADPDGYGMELYWLKRISGEQFFVSLIGAKLIPDEAESPLINCRIAGWSNAASLAREKGVRPPQANDAR